MRSATFEINVGYMWVKYTLSIIRDYQRRQHWRNHILRTVAARENKSRPRVLVEESKQKTFKTRGKQDNPKETHHSKKHVTLALVYTASCSRRWVLRLLTVIDELFGRVYCGFFNVHNLCYKLTPPTTPSQLPHCNVTPIRRGFLIYIPRKYNTLL